MIRVMMLLLAVAGCHRSEADDESHVGELAMSDTKHVDQLVRGFHALEEGKWRWTGREFAFMLKAPKEALRSGARLTLSLFVPPALVAHGASTLTCSFDGVPMPPEPLDKPGLLEMKRDLPPLERRLPVFNCTVSNPLPPSSSDIRELGVVINSARIDSR